MIANLAFEVKVVLLKYALEELAILAILTLQSTTQETSDHLVKLGVRALAEIVKVVGLRLWRSDPPETLEHQGLPEVHTVGCADVGKELLLLDEL